MLLELSQHICNECPANAMFGTVLPGGLCVTWFIESMMLNQLITFSCMPKMLEVAF